MRLEGNRQPARYPAIDTAIVAGVVIQGQAHLLDRLKTWARNLKSDVLALWFCRSHPDTPFCAKVLAFLVAAYAFSPIDLIPDFIPVLGYLDDLILVPIGIYLTLRMLPAHVLADARRQAEAWTAARRTKPRNYLAAGCVVLVWVAATWWAWRAWMA